MLRARRWTCRGVVVALCASALIAVPLATTPSSATAPGVPNSTCVTSPLSGSTYAASVRQVITVRASRSNSTIASLSMWQRRGSCFERVAGPWRADVGARGLLREKHEGDGATPIGTFPIGATMYGIAPNPGVAYPYHRIVCGDWWDEDPSSQSYNRFVHLGCGQTPRFGGDSEALWRVVPQYGYFAVIAYNAAPIVPNSGSAIFLHITTGTPTAGCVALPVAELLRILRALRPALHPRVTIAIAA